MTTFEAYRLFADGDRVTGRIVRMSVDDLSSGDIVIRNAFSSINYKDSLAAVGRNKIIRDYPRIGGIDLFGTVTESHDSRFKAGDKVMVHGFGVGIDHDGGYAEYARVSGDWVMPLPSGVTLKDAAIIGVAGYTAALSIHLMELNGLAPSLGPVVVNGATGGVASIAIDMLSRRGYAVTAITGKQGEHTYLRQLGASEIIDRHSLQSTGRPLEKPLWAGALDSLGGEALGWLTRTMQPQGVIAAFGNALGQELQTTVLPFILRGVRLIGVNANSPMELRKQIWGRIAGDLRPQHLADLAHEIGLRQLPEAFRRLLENHTKGRIVVALDSI